MLIHIDGTKLVDALKRIEDFEMTQKATYIRNDHNVANLMPLRNEFA